MINKSLFAEYSECSDLQIDLITSSRGSSWESSTEFSKNISLHFVPVKNKNIHHSTLIELLRYSFKGLYQAIKLHRQSEYDICFAFSTVPAGGIAYVLNKLFKIPYIVSLQGPDIPGFERRYKYLYPFLKPFICLFWRNAKEVIANSEKHRDLALMTDSSLDIELIYNGVDSHTFTPAKENLERSLVNILSVGRLVKRKGHVHLINAFKRIVDANTSLNLKLTLAGTGDEEGSLKDYVKSLGLATLVDFRGFVARDEMPELYRDADIFVLPSEHEGMSIALLEALASGLPVVVTDVGGTQELVERGKNGFVCQFADEQTLFDALSELVLDKGKRQAMASVSRQVAEKFAWPEIAQQYHKLLER